MQMPIRAAPYRHQRRAFEFAMRLFREAEGGERPNAKGTEQVRPVRQGIHEAES